MTRTAAALLAPLALALGCTAPAELETTFACTAATPEACTDPCRARFSGTDPATLGDPFARLFVRSGDSCPTPTLHNVMEKLRQTDADGCDPSDPRAGIKTRLMSTTAQTTRSAASPDGAGTLFNAITTRACGGRPEFGMIFLMSGLAADPSKGPFTATNPPSPEVIAYDDLGDDDATTGVFNYYVLGNGIHYAGNSEDMLERTPSPPGCNTATGECKCASCHADGGILMRELDTPWLHWEGHVSHPGAAALFAANPDLGSRSDGIDMESRVTEAGNKAWNASRIRRMRDPAFAALVPVPPQLVSTGQLPAGAELSTTGKLLLPLFCSVEVNLDTAADHDTFVDGSSGPNDLRRLPSDSLLDRHLRQAVGVDGSIDVAFADYDGFIRGAGQSLVGVPGGIDTVFDDAFVERAHIDSDDDFDPSDSYLDLLLQQGVVDEELIDDILLVDFTRPVFSSDRCGLVQLVPELAPGEVDAAHLRAALLLALGPDPIPGRDPAAEQRRLALVTSGALAAPAAALRANLAAAGGHAAVVSGFVAACRALGSSAVIGNALRVTSLDRQLARRLGTPRGNGTFVSPYTVFPAIMPVDQLDLFATSPGLRLDPTTCQLTEAFVATPTAGP